MEHFSNAFKVLKPEIHVAVIGIGTLLAASSAPTDMTAAATTLEQDKTKVHLFKRKQLDDLQLQISPKVTEFTRLVINECCNCINRWMVNSDKQTKLIIDAPPTTELIQAITVFIKFWNIHATEKNAVRTFSGQEVLNLILPPPVSFCIYLEEEGSLPFDRSVFSSPSCVHRTLFSTSICFICF